MVAERTQWRVQFVSIFLVATITELPSGHFRVRIRRTGAPLITRSFATRKEAEKWANEQEAALSGGAALPLSVREYREARQMTVADLFERYFTSYHFRQKSEKTQRGEKIKFPHIVRHLGEYSVVNITPGLIAAYRDARINSLSARGGPVSPDQVRLEMALLCIVLELAAGEWQIVPANPCKGVKKPRGNSRDRRITEDEEKRLRIALMARGDDRKLLRFTLLAYYTGMRAGEIAGLRREHVDLPKKQIKLPPTSTKNRQHKIVPLTDQVLNVLKQAVKVAPEDSPFVFSSLTKAGAHKAYDYSCAWQRTLKLAGLSNLRFHDLRHEFVSRLFEQTNLSDGQIAALSGHTDPRSLWRYKHLRTELLRPAMEEVNLQLIDRDVMDDVERAIRDAMIEAVDSPNPDWKKIKNTLGVAQTAQLRKILKKSPG